ncbi:CinA family protein [Poseidonibacter ostreae]|jgi:nicotinamide-nucleotide amidase|uniref:Nicotinamide-nucleotide amidohydrolase family protein n=1 Tax=Poseidonibacter ostreae TaxID=2654171 RepID=A0A6L4WPT2_9BACT|nr:CinA family protein [Poseidonibacter ostreae]KAB7884780.1 nicotinamide-nucleotide amidohydrolase family protein [Poseidonibacter ostreae]KAB7885966.1 nicotinamide-nucleotide amidohydrolase family protein [Poseidonibacter ostreae]KAB7888758.1 nicotinamide-nucleotide amidohydrolase family protein [Poseidonibacter ostreae]MAC83565.1 damage-inducible protein CinA [Arcobacter sp.]|tara:strand:- start:19 stop:525 length:507 start_codon:yes stop_codon:yes gene_type:complete
MYDEIFNENDMITLQNILREQKQSITTAESCTGGLIAHMITKIPNSSDIFNGAIVSYSNKVKNQELNVQNITLENYGAVSCEVVSQMLDGIVEKFDADYAIAVSGIAGPGGGSKEKPVGTVVIGCIGPSNVKKVDIYSFKGSREEVQIQAAKTGLKKIYKFIQKTIDK